MALLFVCGLLGLTTQTADAAELNVEDYTATVSVGSSGLRVRDAPVTGAQIGSLWNGQRVRVTHHVTPGVWRKIVMSNGRAGYVSGDYLSAPPSGSRSGLIIGMDERCLDIANSNQNDVAKVILHPCHGGANQRFRYTDRGEIVTDLNGKCLDVLKPAATDVVMFSCHGRSNQKWYLKSNGTFESAYNGKCLDVWGGNHGIIKVYSCHAGRNQQWRFQSGGPSNPSPSPSPSPNPDLGDWQTKGVTLRASGGVFSVDIPRATPNIWEAAVFQRGVSVTRGGQYRMRFDAKADANRSINFWMGYQPTGSGSYTTIASKGFYLGTGWQTFTRDFTPSVSTSAAQLSFQLGDSAVDIDLRNISLQRIDSPAPAPAPEPEPRPPGGDFPPCEPGLPCDPPPVNVRVESWPPNDSVLRQVRDVIAGEIAGSSASERDAASLISAADDRELKSLCAIAFFQAQRIHDIAPPSITTGVDCLLKLMTAMKRRQAFAEYIEALGLYAQAWGTALEAAVENPVFQFFGITDAAYCYGNAMIAIDPNSTVEDFGSGVCVRTAAGAVFSSVLSTGRLALWLKRGGNRNSRVAGLLGTGTPGRVIRNRLDNSEFELAKKIVGYRGGNLSGPPTNNFAGIDGWLDGVPIQLKFRGGTSPTTASSAAREAGVKASNAGYSGVELFMDTPNLTQEVLLDGPMRDILRQQGSLEAITVFCKDGVLRFVK